VGGAGEVPAAAEGDDVGAGGGTGGWSAGGPGIGGLAAEVEAGADRVRGQAALLRGLAGVPWRGAAGGAFAQQVAGAGAEALVAAVLLERWADALRVHARAAAARAEALERAAALASAGVPLPREGGLPLGAVRGALR